jgi:hypothetical protein
MHESVDSKRERSGSGWRISVAGAGLTERLRTMAFALLGLTAAAGLGLVALFAQPGWPLRGTGPLPATPGQRGAISGTVALARAGGGSGLRAGAVRFVLPAPAPGAGGSAPFAPVSFSAPTPSSSPLLGAAVRTVALPISPGPEGVVPGPAGNGTGEAPPAPEAGAGTASEAPAATDSGGKPSGPGVTTPPVASSATPEEIVAEAESSPPPAEERPSEPAPEESLPEGAPEGEAETPAEEVPPVSTEEVVAEEVAAVETAPEPAAEEPAVAVEAGAESGLADD